MSFSLEQIRGKLGEMKERHANLCGGDRRGKIGKPGL